MIIIPFIVRTSMTEIKFRIIVGDSSYDGQGTIQNSFVKFDTWLESFISLCRVNRAFSEDICRFIELETIEFPLEYETIIPDIEVVVFSKLKSGVNRIDIIKEYFMNRPKIVPAWIEDIQGKKLE